ncbi:TonB-dependent receptor domain-containing protein [Flavobacterium columnare]|uniref:TonB-dependent receptor domain-containing protein n=1 Tax=Flavobacterium columnare TaxID=996 RepID=UPI0013E35531|nr:TonB-dependent receptor [Flavobacterium columnare]
MAVINDKNNQLATGINYSNESYIIHINRSNSFIYDESIQALYFSINKTFFEKLEAQIGLCGENTITKGYSKTLDQTNKRNYFNLFPSIFLNYTFNSYKSLSVNYNRRIDRPSYGDLNPFRFYNTSYNYSEGNPFLNSYLTDNIEIAYTYKNLYTSIYWNHISNGFNEVTYVEPNSIIQRVIPNNFFNQQDLGF